MAKILLVAPSSSHRESLAESLRARGHSVTRVPELSSRSGTRVNPMQFPDLVVIDVTSLTDQSRSLLRQLCQVGRQGSYPAPVLCYSLTYHGPRLELEIERLGARFVNA